MSSSQPIYAYGDGARAVERLKLLGDVFRPTTTALLDSVSDDGVDRVLDLGCGPGCTTAQLAERYREAEIVGVDASRAFISDARSRVRAGMRFAVGDVRHLPLPGAPADVIYARLLLAHLREPATLVERWSTQLRPGGCLVLEEVEDIRTASAILREYLDVATAPLIARRTDMYAGRLLTSMSLPAGLTVERTRSAQLTPSVRDAARLFRLNLETVGHDPAVLSRWSPRALERLAAELEGLLDDPTTGAIRWRMRQSVLRRG